MGDVLVQLQNALHVISQAVLYPVIVLLLAMVCYALFSVGSVVVEFARERRHFTVVIPKFLRAIKETPVAEMPATIAHSGLLFEQRDVLQTVFENRDLDEEGLWALAKRLLVGEKARRQKVVSRNDAVAKLAPMVGLMGTLIPLGPGIVAFGRGDGTVMAQAMLVAFDTTVTGLIVAAVMFVMARVRKRWYASYQASLEAAVTTLLERIGNMPEDQRSTGGSDKGWVNGRARTASNGAPEQPTASAVLGSAPASSPGGFDSPVATAEGGHE